MGLFSFLSDCFGTDSDTLSINPGSGLPMLNSCVDVAGNAFGYGNDSIGGSSLFDSSSSFGSSFGGGFSSFD